MSAPSSPAPALALSVWFADLPAPRVDRTRLHGLTDLVITVCERTNAWFNRFRRLVVR